MAAVLDTGACLLWCERSGRLLWSDVRAARLWAWWPATGATRSWPMPEPLACFALTGSDDRLLLGLASGLAFSAFSTGQVKRICEVDPATRLTGGRCDHQGRFVFGVAGADASQPEAGGFYRLHLDLSLERLPLAAVPIAGSICFSPDGRRMVFADADTGELCWCPYNPCSAEVGAACTFVARDAAPGEPAGMCIDADGYLWSARLDAGQVIRFAPGGAIDRAVMLEAAQPVCLAFGGPGLSTLFVATAQDHSTASERAAAPLPEVVFKDVPGVRGLPEARFLSAGAY